MPCIINRTAWQFVSLWLIGPIGTRSPTVAKHRWLLSCATQVKYIAVCKVSTPQLFNLFISVEFIIKRGD